MYGFKSCINSLTPLSSMPHQSQILLGLINYYIQMHKIVICKKLWHLTLQYFCRNFKELRNPLYRFVYKNLLAFGDLSYNTCLKRNSGCFLSVSWTITLH